MDRLQALQVLLPAAAAAVFAGGVAAWSFAARRLDADGGTTLSRATRLCPHAAVAAAAFLAFGAAAGRVAPLAGFQEGALRTGALLAILAVVLWIRGAHQVWTRLAEREAAAGAGGRWSRSPGVRLALLLALLGCVVLPFLAVPGPPSPAFGGSTGRGEAVLGTVLAWGTALMVPVAALVAQTVLRAMRLPGGREPVPA